MFLPAVLLTAAPAASQERSNDIHKKVLAQVSSTTGADILSGVTELDPAESI